MRYFNLCAAGVARKHHGLKLKTSLYLAALLGFAFTPNALGHDGEYHPEFADGHAPIGVMADHTHKKGEWMLSYRYMRMGMEGSRIGTNEVTPEEIVSTVPNRFADISGQPPNLRIVPTRMNTDMHMAGVMYGLTDRITLMGMGSYVSREMDHTTFAGGMGTNVQGHFTTRSEGFGDTRLAALVSLYEKWNTNVHLTLGMSLQTGSIDKTDNILTPMGGTPTVRLPYPMQLGSGTFDFTPGLTYRGRKGLTSWGTQYEGRVRLERNRFDYSLGDIHMATAWASYRPMPSLSFSARVKARTQGRIDGIDPNIIGPVQTADPDFQGGQRVDILGGVNYAVQSGVLKGHRLAVEYGMPVFQDLNGPQLQNTSTLTIGWQKGF